MRRMARLDPGDLTMLIRSAALLLGVIVPLFLGDAARAATEDFGVWLQALRRDALADGVSKATVDAALTNVTLIDRVIELDRQQPEFTMTFQEYIERVVPPKRVDRGRELLVEYHDLLTQVTRRYGVPQRFIGIFSVMYVTCAAGIASTIGVRMTAGASAFTVMPVSASSLPWLFVIPITAAFEAE